MTAAQELLWLLVTRGAIVLTVENGEEGEVINHQIHAPRRIITPELRAAMAAHRDELTALLEAYDERAAIMEYDGGLPRDEAERRALAMVCCREQLADERSAA